MSFSLPLILVSRIFTLQNDVVAQEAAIRAVQEMGGYVLRDLKKPERPVILVHLSGASVTDDGLATIRTFAKLKTLTINGVKVKDISFASLQGLKHLEYLQLEGCKTPDNVLFYLRDCSKLRTLLLNGDRITDSGMAQLKGLKELEKLSLDCPMVTDTGLAYLKGCSELAYFSTSAKMTDDGLGIIEGKAKMENLFLVGSHLITDAGLARICKMAKLKKLSIEGETISNNGLASLKALQQLEFLRIWSPQVTDAGLVHLSGLKQLKTLWIDCAEVTDQGIERLRKELPTTKIK